MKTREVKIPGSKSFTNRAILIAALSNGVNKITNISKSVDSQIMIKAIKQLGIKTKSIKNGLEIVGNQGIFPEFNGTINVGSAGTATRFLTALKILVPGNLIIKKSKRMAERPINELENALKNIRTGRVSISGNISSQFISSLLMISPLLENGLVINLTSPLVSQSYVDMTIEVMEKFGVKVTKINNRYDIKKQSYKKTNYVVEADASGASYFFGIAAITGQKIRIKINPKSVQGDIKFVDILEKMGCLVLKNNQNQFIEVSGAKVLKGTTVDMSLMPDTAQTLAVVSAFAQGKTKITGLSTLKIKETDRLLALKNELKKIKIKSEITNDSITVFGGFPEKATIETYDDHRMAMSFAVAKAKIPEIIIKNPEVVKKSFPDFWKEFKKL